MARRIVRHYWLDYYRRSGLTACGLSLYGPYEPSVMQWKRVTCKNCLKWHTKRLGK